MVRNIKGGLRAQLRNNNPVCSGAFTGAAFYGADWRGGDDSSHMMEYTFNANNVVPTSTENKPYTIYALPLLTY